MGKRSLFLLIAVILAGGAVGLTPTLCWGQGAGLPLPALNIGVGEAKNPGMFRSWFKFFSS